MTLVRDTDFDAPIDIVGGKAWHLIDLKKVEGELQEAVRNGVAYLPRLFVIPTAFDLEGRSSEVLSLARELGCERFAVRSTAIAERGGIFSYPGIFLTELDVALEDLPRHAKQVRESPHSEKAQEYAARCGLELEDTIPVIVSAMGQGRNNDTIYTKFPSPHDVMKIVRFGYHEKQNIGVFERRYVSGLSVDLSDPMVMMDCYQRPEIEPITQAALFIEKHYGQPARIEACTRPRFERGCRAEIAIVQSQRLVSLPHEELFIMPELQDSALLHATNSVSGVGDITQVAYYFCPSQVASADFGGDMRKMADESQKRWYQAVRELRMFDEEHPEGYILVAPNLKRAYDRGIEYDAPGMTGLLTYGEWMKTNHDFEVARERNILFLSCYHLGRKFKQDKPPIETGDIVRMVSDGVHGFVYNLSRQ